MYYSGRDNDAYRKYAQYRDWLYAVDDLVIVGIYISLFDLPVAPTKYWYDTGVSCYEAAIRILIRWTYSHKEML